MDNIDYFYEISSYSTNFRDLALIVDPFILIDMHIFE